MPTVFLSDVFRPGPADRYAPVGSRRAWKESSDERSFGDSFLRLYLCVGVHQLPTPYVHACVPVAFTFSRTPVWE